MQQKGESDSVSSTFCGAASLKREGQCELEHRQPSAADRLLADGQQGNGTSALQLQGTNFHKQPE